jgi:hypothetical protein
VQNGQERVSRALDALTEGLYPFVERELKTHYRDRWHDEARSSFRDDYAPNAPRGDVVRWDAHALLTVMWDQWNRVFRHKLSQPERSLTSELRDFRNRWAHQEVFGFDDTYRILDSCERLLRAVGADEVAERLSRDKHDLLRTEYSREARLAHRKAQITRRERLDLFIYGICCVSIVAVIFNSFGIQSWYFSVFVVLIFAFLAYQRSISQPPLFFGPHECTACRRIIYGESCPYCEPDPGAPRRLVSLDSARPPKRGKAKAENAETLATSKS